MQVVLSKLVYNTDLMQLRRNRSRHDLIELPQFQRSRILAVVYTDGELRHITFHNVNLEQA